jgi:hypothetical protein
MGRLRNAVTSLSSSLAIRLTWDFDNRSMPRVWTNLSTRRVLTPRT